MTVKSSAQRQIYNWQMSSVMFVVVIVLLWKVKGESYFGKFLRASQRKRRLPEVY